MKLFQANSQGRLSAGVAVRRDESNRPYIFVGADLTLGSALATNNPPREVGKRVYLTGALWQQVLNKCQGSDEFVYEADLIAGLDGTFVLGPCSGQSDAVLVNCSVTNWVETSVQTPAVEASQAVCFDGKTSFIAGEQYLHTAARLVPIKAGEQVVFNWTDREPDQDTTPVFTRGCISPREITNWKDVPKSHAVSFPG